MSTIARQTIRSIRTIHTTSRVLSDTPPKSLGFGDYTGRTRSLPTIDIPASSRLHVGRERTNKPNVNAKAGQKGENKGPRQQVRPRLDGKDNAQSSGARKFPEKREKRQSKSPLVQSSKTSTGTSTSTNTQGEPEGEEFFTMSGDSAGSTSRKQMDTVDIDFSSEGQAPRLNSSSKSRNVASGSNSKAGSKRNTKGGRSIGSEPAKREDDRSSEGIFGRASLLFPLRRGARLAEQSIWAEGMKSEDARKAELERLIGKPTAYLPDVAYPTDLARNGKNAARTSKDLASWIMATNPGISMRREKTGQAVLETYLK